MKWNGILFLPWNEYNQTVKVNTVCCRNIFLSRCFCRSLQYVAFCTLSPRSPQVLAVWVSWKCETQHALLDGKVAAGATGSLSFVRFFFFFFFHPRWAHQRAHADPFRHRNVSLLLLSIATVFLFLSFFHYTTHPSMCVMPSHSSASLLVMDGLTNTSLS